MTILCADDELLALDILVEAVREAVPEARTEGFLEAEALLEYATEHDCSVAFLDIQMREMNGLALAKRLKDINARVNIVFVTGYDQYTGDALYLRASGYVMKPATKEKILEELENLRNPLPEEASPKLRIQCFGNFEVFAGEKPVFFQRSRTKELLAYLVDRMGAVCTMGELIGILWENTPDSASQRSQLRKLIADLRAAMKECGAEDMLIKQRNVIALDCSKVDCDYYRFLQGDPAAVNLYHGEYMSQYSWAEMTIANLSNL